jgi:prepilin signal peptidase PulO-like enzyme (type II secretory pathway)
MISIVLLVLGLVTGSFLGALTYRLPRRISINEGRSKCPECNHQISWFDNIPVLSFLILHGKCRNCKVKISPRYPLIESVTAVTFVIIGFNPLSLIFALILIAVFVIDLEHQIIPDELTFFGLLFLTLNLLLFNQELLFVNLLAGLISANILLFLNLITNGRGMGLGDVKLAILIGAIVGLNMFLVWIFFSFIAGSIVGIILIALKKANLKQKIAFGPFLIIGLVLSFYFGPAFLSLLNL